MSEIPNIDLDELGRLVYDAINEFGPYDRQVAAVNRLVDILTEQADYGDNVVRCAVCLGKRLPVALMEGGETPRHVCAVCYAEELISDREVDQVANE